MLGQSRDFFLGNPDIPRPASAAVAALLAGEVQPVGVPGGFGVLNDIELHAREPIISMRAPASNETSQSATLVGDEHGTRIVAGDRDCRWGDRDRDCCVDYPARPGVAGDSDDDGCDATSDVMRDN